MKAGDKLEKVLSSVAVKIYNLFLYHHFMESFSRIVLRTTLCDESGEEVLCLLL
jgi:hypothetical protein